MKKLTKKQQEFVREYLATSNGSLAARKAYSVTSTHSAEQIAYENLRKPEIMAEIANGTGSLLDADSLSITLYDEIFLKPANTTGERLARIKAINIAAKLIGAYRKSPQREKSLPLIIEIKNS